MDNVERYILTYWAVSCTNTQQLLMQFSLNAIICSLAIARKLVSLICKMPAQNSFNAFSCSIARGRLYQRIKDWSFVESHMQTLSVELLRSMKCKQSWAELMKNSSNNHMIMMVESCDSANRNGRISIDGSSWSGAVFVTMLSICHPCVSSLERCHLHAN